MPVPAHAQLGTDARANHRWFRHVLVAVLPPGDRCSVLWRVLQRPGASFIGRTLARILQFSAQSRHLCDLGPQLPQLF